MLQALGFAVYHQYFLYQRMFQASQQPPFPLQAGSSCEVYFDFHDSIYKYESKPINITNQVLIRKIYLVILNKHLFRNLIISQT
jgi:hypothetical protein